MALSVKQGTFLTGTGTGNVSVSGVGFLPKLVMFFSRGSNGDGVSAGARMSIGAMCTGGLQGANSYRAVDAQGAEVSSRFYRSARMCMFANDTSAAASATISVGYVSLDADGFTVNVSTNSEALSVMIGYLALGGTDIDYVTIGHTTIPAATATTTINTLDQNLTGLILMSTTQVAGDNSHAADGELMMGFFDGVNQSVCAIKTNDADDPTAVSRTISTSHIMARIADSSDSRDGDSTAKFITGGFELTHTNQYGAENHIMYIGINGPRFKVGNTTMPGTATTDFSVTGVGFQPSGLMQMNIATIDTDGTNTTFNQGWFNAGIATGSAAQFECGIEGQDAQGTSNNNRFSNDAKFIERNDHGTTSQITAVVKTLDADGFTLTQDLATSSAKLRIVYMAIGSKKGYPQIDIGSTWKEVNGMNVNISGAWKMIPMGKASIDISSAWKTI
jgi:hypothetical protein